MTIRRRLIQLALAAMVVPATWLAPNADAHAQAFQQFFPLLIDLPGWQGGKPDGAAMQIPGSSMVSGHARIPTRRSAARCAGADRRDGTGRGGRGRHGGEDRDQAERA